MKNKFVVAGVIKDKDKYFATQRGHGDYKDAWEFPGGKVEPGEDPVDAIRREIKEELDTDVEVGDLIHVVEYDYPDFHLIMNCYLCYTDSNSIKLLEHEDSAWVDEDNVTSLRWLPADVEVLEKLFPNVKRDKYSFFSR